MPARKRLPQYCHHKPTGQAYVRIDGKFHYLGAYDSEDSRKEYRRLIDRWLLRNSESHRFELTIGELMLLYAEHVEQHYVKHGKPTSEQSCIKTSLRYLNRYRRERVDDFGPLKLKSVRDGMIQDGICRSSINKNVERIRRCFKWAVENELCPPSTLAALQAVRGLSAGRTAAPESEPVLPVPIDQVEATLPFMPPPVAALVKLQLLTGARPGELLIMRGADIKMTGDVWEYRPQSHKTEHHGKARMIFLGPQAQEVIREFLKPNVEAYLFSPAEAEAERKAELRQNRKTPVQPSQQNRSRGTRKYGECYHRDSYRNAIHRACEKAFGMPDHLRKIPRALPAEQRERLQAEARAWRRQHCWSPHRLRHNAATEIRKIADLDTARSVLGHSSLRVTEIYAERDSQAARSIMAKIG